jgi:protein tyrosine/serine phosphatase
MKAPFPKSWWVEPGRILAGCYPGSLSPNEADAKLIALLDAGIRSIFCLQQEHETGQDGQPFVDYLNRLNELAEARGLDIAWQRFAIRDADVPSSQLMRDILKAIELALSANRPVYIHCWGGHGRTGTVVGCWLVNQGFSGEQALERISQLRQFDPYLRKQLAPYTEEQCQMVLSFQ